MINKKSNYDNAVELYNNGEYEEAISSFEKLNGYKESDSYLEKSVLGYATELMNNGSYIEAIEFLQDTSIAKETNTGIKINECKKLLYNEACSLMKEENYGDAIDIFTYLESYMDSNSLLNECNKEYEWNINISKVENNNTDWNYFAENIGQYRQLSSSELNEVMVGKWNVYYTKHSIVVEYTSNQEYYTLIDGEIPGKSSAWGVSGDRIWIGDPTLLYKIYEMKEGYYLMQDQDGTLQAIYKRK